MPEKLSTFTWNGQKLSVSFVETTPVKDGVECDIYTFQNDSTRDLGIIRVAKGASTPLQRALKGDRTIEGYMSGHGTFMLGLEDGVTERYEFPNEQGLTEITVGIGQTMQWIAEDDLVAYEVCEPPYEDGRFKDLPE